MGISMKVSGAWKAMKAAYVNVGGTWKQCTSVYIRQGGKWISLLPLTKALSKLTNDTTNSTSISNVRVGSTITVTYTAVNNTYDGSDYITIGWSGCTISAAQNGSITSTTTWKLGPKAGTYTATFTATSSTVTFSITGHGMTSATGSALYFYEKAA